VVKLLRIEEGTLEVENLDILDGTPILDIKPYMPDFDYVEDVRVGWLADQRDQIPDTLSDDRFNA
jgi:tRNA (Thr-GGU) A37 N-methylase